MAFLDAFLVEAEHTKSIKIINREAEKEANNSGGDAFSNLYAILSWIRMLFPGAAFR